MAKRTYYHHFRDRKQWPPPGARADGLCRGCLRDGRNVMLRRTYWGRQAHFYWAHKPLGSGYNMYRPSPGPFVIIPPVLALIYLMWAVSK